MKLVWGLILILLTLFIWYNSSLPAVTSGYISGIVAAFIQKLASVLNMSTDGNLEHTLRKLAHFCEFGFLCWVCCRTMEAWFVGKRTANGYILFYCLLVAVIDEYIQQFSPGRWASLKDVLLDFSGAFSLWLTYRCWQWCK